MASSERSSSVSFLGERVWAAVRTACKGALVTTPAGAWTLRLYQKPFIRWIWFGGLFMMLGGFVAAADRRLRHPRNTAAVVTTPAVGESLA